MMTNDEQNRPDQRETIERLLDDEQVLVHVNPASAGLLVPEHLKDSRTVTLRLSRYFKGDLLTDDQKVSAQLLFGSEYFTCEIPWASIWGASSVREEEFLWPEAAPSEILEMALAQQQRQSAGKVPPFSQSVAARQSEDGTQARSKPKRAASHLKRVK